jgi:hypothetical protein
MRTKTKAYIAVIICFAVILFFYTSQSRNPDQNIVGVWELSKVSNLSPSDAGFVGNIKLVFHPNGTLYRMDPEQADLNEHDELNIFTYSIENNDLIRTNNDGNSTRAPFSLRGKTLIITECDGEKINFKKRTADYSKIPVWAPKTVPFSVKHE